jgi:hypothetical protein
MNEVTPGFGIVLGIALLVIFLFSVRRYPKEELFALFGIVFGLIILLGIGGAYTLLSAGHEVIGIIWIVMWIISFILFQRPVRRRLTPTFFIADEFVRMVGPIPGSQELPRGCFIIAFESILFFILLMVAGLLGPILWVVHIILFAIFEKRNRDRSIKWTKILSFIVMNIVLLVILSILLDSIGAEAFLREIMGG